MSTERPSLRANEVGSHYDNWEVIEYAGAKYGKALWKVRCSKCQYEAATLGRALRKGVYPRHKCAVQVCRKCNKSSKEVKFRGTGRFGNICEQCRKEYETEWRSKNAEYVAAYIQEWNATNREKVNKYHEAERQKAQSCPYKFLIFTLKVKERNHRMHMTTSKPSERSKRTKARPELHHFLITAEFLHRLWDSQSGRCAITGMEMSHRFNDLKAVSVDRIESTRGYTEDNVQLVCRWVNLAKGKFSNDEIRKVLDEFRRSSGICGSGDTEASMAGGEGLV